jgi:hypothetical protein
MRHVLRSFEGICGRTNRVPFYRIAVEHSDYFRAKRGIRPQFRLMEYSNVDGPFSEFELHLGLHVLSLDR